MVRAIFRFQIDRGFTPGQCASPFDPKRGKEIRFFCLSGNLRPISVRLRFLSHVKVASPFVPLEGEENRLVHRSALHRDDLDLCWGFLTPCAYPCW